MIIPLLAIEGLGKRFSRGGAEIVALDNVGLEIGRGETLALVGPSGSGKSTLARILMRLVEPNSGTVAFDGSDLLALRGAALRTRRRDLQMVLQDPLAAFNQRATVARVLDDPLRIHGIAERARRPALIDGLLERVGLSTTLRNRYVHEISGGQRQRVAIARAIATRPKFIVLDEALSALDVLVRADVIGLLLDLQREEGLAYLLISHDLSMAASVAGRIAIMDRGRIVETGDAHAVIADPVSRTGQALVAAIPRLPVGGEGTVS